MNKSFTLIELIVVTSIIILLSAIVFPNYRGIERQFALQRSAHKLAQDIRRAGEMAMSTKEFQGKVPAGYGIYLKQGERDYLLYADTNPSQGNEKYDGGDGKIETINLEKGVYIQNISPSSLSINFKPPIPTIKIKTKGEDSTTAVITLSLESDSTKTKIIKVNSAGLINVIDAE